MHNDIVQSSDIDTTCNFFFYSNSIKVISAVIVEFQQANAIVNIGSAAKRHLQFSFAHTSSMNGQNHHITLVYLRGQQCSTRERLFADLFVLVLSPEPRI